MSDYSPPRMGDNIDAPYGQSVTERLEQDHAELLAKAKNILADAEDLPVVVQTSFDVSAIADVVVKMRDLAARSESHRKAEKEPYMRAGEAVDAFFFKRVKEPLDVERKGLSARLDVYKQRQLAEERARREAEAAAARKVAEEARRLREEAEAAERRARSVAASELRAAEAAAARVAADMATVKAEETALATMVKSGRMVGERFEGSDRSGQVTMRKTPVVMIDDVAQLDLALLRPFIKEEHLLMALKSWAKATSYQQEMPGATVALRDATVVR